MHAGWALCLDSRALIACACLAICGVMRPPRRRSLLTLFNKETHGSMSLVSKALYTRRLASAHVGHLLAHPLLLQPPPVGREPHSLSAWEGRIMCLIVSCCRSPTDSSAAACAAGGLGPMIWRHHHHARSHLLQGACFGSTFFNGPGGSGFCPASASTLFTPCKAACKAMQQCMVSGLAAGSSRGSPLLQCWKARHFEDYSNGVQSSAIATGRAATELPFLCNAVCGAADARRDPVLGQQQSPTTAAEPDITG
jgi:hypothetical protein